MNQGGVHGERRVFHVDLLLKHIWVTIPPMNIHGIRIPAHEHVTAN